MSPLSSKHRGAYLTYFLLDVLDKSCPNIYIMQENEKDKLIKELMEKKKKLEKIQDEIAKQLRKLIYAA